MIEVTSKVPIYEKNGQQSKGLTPPRLEVLERRHDGRGARRGRRRPLPLLPELEGFDHLIPTDQPHVRTRAEELDLKP